MAVVKEKEIIVDKGIREVFSLIEGDFKKRTETLMEERELTEESGIFKIFFKKNLLSNGEYMQVELAKLEEGKTRITMASRSKVEKTVLDWGKNEKNIRLILELMGVVPKDEKKGVYYPGRK